MNADWFLAQSINSWVMPATKWWKRLPLIRHIRFIFLSYDVHQHNLIFSHFGYYSSGYDEWILAGICGGMERIEK